MSVPQATICPRCTIRVYHTAKHCPSPSCPWLNCRCGTIFDPRTGQHIPPPQPKDTK